MKKFAGTFAAVFFGIMTAAVFVVMLHVVKDPFLTVEEMKTPEFLVCVCVWAVWIFSGIVFAIFRIRSKNER